MPPSPRVTRALGLVSLVGAVAWAAARFQRLPLSSLGLAHVVAILGWALLLHGVLLLAERLSRGDRESWADYARVYFLLLFSCGTLAGYINAHRVGPLDAQWYQNVMADFITQSRAGTFPVTLGETVYAFNGAVHPFRSAPWQFVLAYGLDRLSGRVLLPVAVQHLSAIVSYAAAVLVLYVGFARARPGRKTQAWVAAIAFAMSPAVTVPFLQYDMYMTLTALPFMALVMLCAFHAIDEESLVAWLWLGVFSAALWYCHPPMALFTGIIAGGILVGAMAVRGVTWTRLAGAVVSACAFVPLARPYFQSMSELARIETSPLASVAMPALGLAACLFSMAGFLRSRSPYWLCILPLGLACLREFQPSLVPFSAIFAVIAVLVAWITRLRSRSYDALYLIGSATIAAAFAATVFPRSSLPGNSTIRDGIQDLGSHWKTLLEPIFLDGTRNQPGYLYVCLGLGIVGLGYKSKSIFVQCAAGAILTLAVAFGFCGCLSQFLLQNIPKDIADVIGLGYDLRILPILAVVVATGGFFWLTSLSGKLGNAVFVAILCMMPWSLAEHGLVLNAVKDYKLSDADTDARNRSENLVLERYSWDLLPPPRYMGHGVMDPALETRFWSDVNHETPAIDADQIERALESPGQVPIRVVATPIPTAKSWLTLDPKIELDPGQHVLLRFDFMGGMPEGYLIVQGQTISREYLLPSSGRNYAFGAAPGNTRTLSLWNSSGRHESVQLLITRSGPHASEPPKAVPYCLLYVTPYDPKRAPIELFSVWPLHLRVEAPTAGYVETYRTMIPGYKVYLDDKPAMIHSSRNALVSVRVTPGAHDLHVRFAGTVLLHTAIRMATLLWLLVAAVAVLQLWVMCRKEGAGV